MADFPYGRREPQYVLDCAKQIKVGIIKTNDRNIRETLSMAVSPSQQIL